MRVMIESPFKPKALSNTPEFAAELQRNIDYAWDLVRDSLRRGEAPFASHLFYPQVLSGGDDRDPVERQLGIDAGTAWAEAADKLVVGTDLGITEGTIKRIDDLYARRESHRGRRSMLESLQVEHRSLPAWVGKHA